MLRQDASIYGNHLVYKLNLILVSFEIDVISI